MKETCSFAKEMGKRVAQRRKELGLTQEKAAERCGLSQQFFASIETGWKNVRGESLLKLAMGLDISADYLLTGRVTDLELDQLLTACCIARDGKGCTFLRDGMARFLEDGGRLVYYKLGDPAAHRPVMLAWRKSAELSRPAKALLEFLTGGNGQTE